jgi:hypothetical protein
MAILAQVKAKPEYLAHRLHQDQAAAACKRAAA